MCKCYFLLFLLLQTLYTHIVTDIKNVNAKHKNNKVNTVSILVFRCTSIYYLVLLKIGNNKRFPTFFLDAAELHVYHVEGQ